jgi:methylated-DNA-[protein]-cysteine S-methyltransferase
MNTPTHANSTGSETASGVLDDLQLNHLLLDSPVGTLRLWSNGRQLVRIEFNASEAGPADTQRQDDPVLQRGGEQLEEYFAGKRRTFDLPLAPQGTAFQHSVWRALAEIPWGQWRSYGDIARAIGRPRAVRAVGAANGRNPLPIVVPCHRVVGSDGSLTGFAGGLETKRYLLELEGSLRQLQG